MYTGKIRGCVYTLMFVEGLSFTALGPLLPTLKDGLDLSTSQAGLLAASYVAGAVIGAIPAALASASLGVKNCSIAGAALLAGGTLVFGVGGTYAVLITAQLAAGLGAAGIWIGAAPWLLDVSPDGERGQAIGTMLGVAAVGEIVGPVVGASAANAGRTATFAPIAIVALIAAVVLSRSPAPPSVRGALAVRASAASRPVRAAVWLVFAPAAAWGGLVVLGTLQLDRLGAGPTAIAVTFVVAAAIGAAQGPLVGRWSDRRGRLPPIRLGLFLCIPAFVALSSTERRLAVALLIVFALIAIRFTIGPSVALLSDACRHTGGDILALAITLPANAGGLAVGSAGAGALAQAAGSSWTYNAVTVGVFAVFLTTLRSVTNDADLPVIR